MPTRTGHHFYLEEGRVETPRLSLPQLYNAGVDCGHTEARFELKRRVAVVDQQLEEFRAIRDRAQGDREHLAAELLSAQRVLLKMQMHTGHVETSLAAARHRIDELELSTTWRLSAPIRDAGHHAKVLAARARARWAAIRRAPQFAATAWSIFRNEGTEAVFQRAWAKVNGRGRFKSSRVAMFRLEEEITPLAVPGSDTPQVSIVIPVFGKPLLTFTCL